MDILPVSARDGTCEASSICSSEEPSPGAVVYCYDGHVDRLVGSDDSKGCDGGRIPSLKDRGLATDNGLGPR